MQKRLDGIAVVRHLQAEISHQAAANLGRRPVDSDQFFKVPPQPLEWRTFALEHLASPFVFYVNVECKHLFCEGFFAGKVMIERPLRHIGLVKDLLHPGSRIPHRVDTPQPHLEKMIPRASSFHFASHHSFSNTTTRPVCAMLYGIERCTL